MLAAAACNSNAPGIAYTVVLSPASATVTAGRTFQLGALARGKVTWTVQEANGGTVDANGLYTAPSTPGTYHLTATSVDDPKKSATATVTVVAAAATPAIALPAKITAGRSATASVVPQDGVTFAWSAFNAALAATSGTSVGVTAGSAGGLAVSCVATNAAGDSAPAAVAVAQVVPPAVSPPILAPYAVTTGRGGLSASAPADPALTYKWTIGNGSIDGPATGPAISFTAGTPGDLVLTLTASNAAGDPASPSTATVHVHDFGLELVAGAPGAFGNGDGKGPEARLSGPVALAEDPSGNLMVSDTQNHTIRKIAPDGTVTTLAGAAGQAAFADGQGGAARFNDPNGIAADGQGNAYVVDTGNFRIRRIGPDGTTVTVAGGAPGTADGPALGGGQLNFARALAMTPDAGEIWFGDSSSIRLLKADGGTPWITTAATLGGPVSGLALDPSGVMATQPCQVQVYDGGVANVAGGATCAYADGPGASAQFSLPWGIATSPAGGAAFVSDRNNGLLRRLDFDAGGGVWEVSTAAGQLADAGTDDGPVATARVSSLFGVAWRASGAVAFTDQDTIRQLAGGSIQTLAGAPQHPGHADGPGAAARFMLSAQGETGTIAVDDDGTAYLAEPNHVRRIDPDGTVSTVAGNGGSGVVDGLAGSAQFAGLSDIALDRTNRILYLLDSAAGIVRALTHDPQFDADVVHTIANVPYSCGDATGNALGQTLCTPAGLAVDPAGRVFVSDGEFSTIRMLERSADGGEYLISTVASSGVCNVQGLASDAQGRIFFSDGCGSLVKVLEEDAGVWTVTTIAGSGTCASNDGEGLDAGFCSPQAVTVDRDGRVWVADRSNAAVRRLTFNSVSSAWKVETVGGIPGSTGVRPGPLPGRVNRPFGVGATPFGDVMVVDSLENSVLMLRPQ